MDISGLREFLHWLEEVYGPPNVEPPPRTPWRVVKRDGSIEPFQISKLERSVQIASKGRQRGCKSTFRLDSLDGGK